MKNLEKASAVLAGLAPSDAVKTVLFCEVEKRAYELFFYSYDAAGCCKQCYELVEEEKLDGVALEKGFEEIAALIRTSTVFDAEKRNVVTVVLDGKGKDIKTEAFEKSVGLYKIKKEWKAANI